MLFRKSKTKQIEELMNNIKKIEVCVCVSVFWVNTAQQQLSMYEKLKKSEPLCRKTEIAIMTKIDHDGVTCSVASMQ